MADPVPVNSFSAQLNELREQLREALSHGGGGGTFSGMDQRVTRLETHVEYVRRDLDTIVTKLDTLLERTDDLPTKSDLTTFRWQWVATAVAAIALIVGGIIGGLGWIKPDDPQPAPTIIQMPPQSAPLTAPPAKVDNASR